MTGEIKKPVKFPDISRFNTQIETPKFKSSEQKKFQVFNESN